MDSFTGVKVDGYPPSSLPPEKKESPPLTKQTALSMINYLRKDLVWLEGFCIGASPGVTIAGRRIDMMRTTINRLTVTLGIEDAKDQ